MRVRRIAIAVLILVLVPVLVWSVKRYLELRSEHADLLGQRRELVGLLREYTVDREQGLVLAHLCRAERIRVPVNDMQRPEFVLDGCAGVLAVEAPEMPYLGKRCTGVYFRGHSPDAPDERWLVLAYKLDDGGYVFNVHPESESGQGALRGERERSMELEP